jgi:hypothetical protein
MCWSVLPEILEPIWSHFGVSHGVHDILVAHVVLERSGVMPIVGELVAGRMPQHVRVDRERELCRFSGPGDRFQETCSRHAAQTQIADAQPEIAP